MISANFSMVMHQLHSLKLDITLGANTAVQDVVLNHATLMISLTAFTAPSHPLLKDNSSS